MAEYRITAVHQIAAAGASGLQYLGAAAWQFNWQTTESLACQCRVITLDLADGTSHVA